MRESKIEAALVKHVTALGGLCEKFTSPSKRGVPDRIVTLPEGVIIFVELKTKTGKVSKLQQRDHGKRKALGCDVRIIDSIEGVNAFPQQLKG